MHEHDQIAGAETERSGYYSNDLVKVIGQAILGRADEEESAEELESSDSIADEGGLRPVEDAADPPDTGGASGSGGQPGVPVAEHAAETPMVEEEEVGEEERSARIQQLPRVAPTATQPGKMEMLRRRVTHVPYAGWCPECVAGRGRDRPHQQGQQLETPLVEVDYGFLGMGTEERQMTAPVLLARVRPGGYCFACVATQKGRGDVYAIGQLHAFLEEAGLAGQVIRMRTDLEPAVRAIVAEVAVRRGRSGMTLPETTPKGSHSSTGSVEQLSGSIAGLVRTWVLAMQRAWKYTANAESPLLHWMVRHASWLMNRFQAQTSTKLSPYEYLRSAAYHGEVHAFGDAVIGRVAGALEQPKMRARWQRGIWLGKQIGGDEHIVGSSEGVFATRAVRALPEHERVIDLINQMTYTPRSPVPLEKPKEQGKVQRDTPRESSRSNCKSNRELRKEDKFEVWEVIDSQMRGY